LFDALTIERLAAHFIQVLKQLAAGLDTHVFAASLLSEAETRQLQAWNETRATLPAQTLSAAFEAQAAKTPELPALLFEDEQLSYAELNARANQLAHQLRKLGIGPDVPVALHIERSIEMVVGVVAVLKASGAYVPIDSSYPEERKRLMLE